MTFSQHYKAAQNGDHEAQQALIELIQPRLLRFLKRRMGQQAKRVTEAEDLLQSTLLDLLSRLKKYPADLTESEFTAYGLQLAKWRLADLFDKDRIVEGESFMPKAEKAQHQSPGLVTRQDDVRWTAEQIDALPENFRDVMKLHYLQGLDPTAVAKQLAISDTNFRKRLSRGRELLRQNIDAKRAKDLK